jgi:murein DD-endopeptidase MepM/ murein hydrolase activator NlpD
MSRILVGVGQHVGRGRRVGLVGSSGHATGPHLHFEVRAGGAIVDPLTALR